MIIILYILLYYILSKWDVLLVIHNFRELKSLTKKAKILAKISTYVIQNKRYRTEMSCMISLSNYSPGKLTIITVWMRHTSCPPNPPPPPPFPPPQDFSHFTEKKHVICNNAHPPKFKHVHCMFQFQRNFRNILILHVLWKCTYRYLMMWKHMHLLSFCIWFILYKIHVHVCEMSLKLNWAKLLNLVMHS